MADLTIANVGEKLIVGQLDTSFVTLSSKFVPGTAVLNGPVYIGAAIQGGVPSAACMIGPPLPNVTFPASLDVKGISFFTGTTNVLGNLNVPAVSNFTGLVTINAVEIKNGVDLKNALSLGNDRTVCNAPVIINSIVKADDFFSSAGGLNATTKVALKALEIAVGKKAFDIQHPSKNGYRLRHICVEGPTADVYFRGKLKDSDAIVIPDYWHKLVDIESISVSLTPIGTYQELFVEKVEWGRKIIIKNNLGTSINCSYIVYGERIDGEKNIPEYEGLTPTDYPGDNREYVINSL
jgi:hypothetical protein